MDNGQLLFGLHQLPTIGWKSIRSIVHRARRFDELLTLQSGDWEQLGLGKAKAELLSRRLTRPFIEQKLEAYREAGIGIVTVWDEAYPPLLKETSQPPWVLYYKGDISLARRPLLAVVGTRTPTVYGKHAAEALSKSLAQAGFCVVSGLARGIDAAAHLGALQGEGSTAAVLGTDMATVYPAENAGLFRRIGERGLIVSEYPLGTPRHPGLFPLRNRVIAGMSLGTVVVEAAEKSGSLITADQALEESRDVFAVPGPLNSPKSRGTLSLLKQGAKIVTGVEDIIEEYVHMMNVKAPDAPGAGRRPSVELTPDERLVLNWISHEPVTTDLLLEKTKLRFGHLHSVLLSLLMKKMIAQLPGSSYITF